MQVIPSRVVQIAAASAFEEMERKMIKIKFTESLNLG
jgi:hypothetical protein